MFEPPADLQKPLENTLKFSIINEPLKEHLDSKSVFNQYDKRIDVILSFRHDDCWIYVT